MILSGLSRRNLLFAVSVALIGLSLVLRPTSTLAFSAAVAALFVATHRLRLRRVLRVGCIVAACAILAINLAILESDAVAQTLYSFEPLIKTNVFEAQDNSITRLGFIDAARDEMARYPLLIGKAFAGDVTVNVMRYLPWSQSPVMPIHSDFMIMVMEGGLIGYGLFAALFIGMALLCAKAAHLAHAAGDPASETVFDALQAMNVVFMLYISGFPMLTSPQQATPYLILVPLAIFLARAQPGFAGSSPPPRARGRQTH